MNNLIKIKDGALKFINNIFLFKYMSIILFFISFIPILRIYIGFSTKFILVWGAYLVIYKILIKRQFNRKSGIIILFFLLVSYFISIVINYKNNFFHNFLNLSYMTMMLLLIYGVDSKKDAEVYIKEFKALSNLFAGIFFVTGIISIIMFFLIIKFKVLANNQRINVGFLYNRLYGIYLSVNVSAIISSVVIAICFFNLYLNRKRKGKKLLKTYYVINIIVQTIFLILSDSRGGFITAIVIFIFFAAFYLYGRVVYFKENKLKAIVIFALCLAVSCGCYVGLSPAREILSRIPNLLSDINPDIRARSKMLDRYLSPQENLSFLIDDKIIYYIPPEASEDPESSDYIPPIDSLTDDTKQEIEAGREDYDFMGSRLNIWISQIKAFATSPIFGIASSDLKDYPDLPSKIPTLTDADKKDLIRVAGNAHNSYIQILVTGGIVAFILFAIFTVWIFFKGLYTLLKKKLKFNQYVLLSFVMALNFSFFIVSVAESHIIFRYADFLGIMIWIYLGYTFLFISSFKSVFEGAEDKKRELYICATPYHILTAINKVHFNKNNDTNYELLISPDFKNVELLSKNLKKLKIFERIEILKDTNVSYTPKKSLKNLLFGNKNIKNLLKKRKYTEIYYFFTNPIIFTMVNEYVDEYNENCKYYFVEDGIGSYIAYSERLTLKMNLVYTILGIESMSLKCDGFWFYKPEAVCIDIKGKKNKLPSWDTLKTDKKFLNKLNDAFGFKLNTDYKSEALYFNQPIKEDGIAVIDEQENDYLKEVAASYKSFAIKCHPRFLRYDIYKDFNVINDNIPFELICLNISMKDTVLITPFSTAVLAPQMILNEHPKIIFLYEKFGLCENEILKDYLKNLNALRKKLQLIEN
jgi:Lipid A core - O-antigen ligase and related enzymes